METEERLGMTLGKIGRREVEREGDTGAFVCSIVDEEATEKDEVEEERREKEGRGRCQCLLSGR